MKRKEILEYFVFTKKEVNGILLLSCAMVITGIAHIVLPWVWNKDPVHVDLRFIPEIPNDSTTDFTPREYSLKRSTYAPAGSDSFPRQNFFSPEKKYTKRVVHIVNINTADSSEIDRIPGVSSGLASRLIRYRNRLGGFHSAEQIGEIYYIPDYARDSILKYTAGYGQDVRKIKINETCDSTLGQHPYLNTSLSRTICSYRDKHGAFTRCEDLLPIHRLEPEQIQRICPYLDFSPG